MQGVSRPEQDDAGARMPSVSGASRHMNVELVSADVLRAGSAKQISAVRSETPKREPQHRTKAVAAILMGPTNDGDLTAEQHTLGTST